MVMHGHMEHAAACLSYALIDCNSCLAAIIKASLGHSGMGEA